VFGVLGAYSQESTGNWNIVLLGFLKPVEGLKARVDV
jgi:hypothetical protein